VAGKELQIIIKAIDRASSVFDGVEKKATGLGGALGTLGKVGGLALAGVATAGAAVGTALVGAGAAMGKLAVDAAPLAGIQAAFEGITENSDAMLASLREGSLGMVTDIDLMKNYNQAAMLVGDTFAEQLPDAMTYLTKVSAATGTSMDSLMNSLVTGVGRLSPMILDNLAIQVSLAEATERASEMYGVAADELTKEQQQAGMMDVIMEKLAETTAEMPEVAGTAAASWAALGVTFKNLKDQVGLALVPALETLLNALVPLIQEYGPRLVTLFAEKVVPVVEKVAEALALLLEGDLEGALVKLFGEERAGQILGFADAMSKAFDSIKAWYEAPIAERLDKTWEALSSLVTELPAKMVGFSEAILKWSESPATQDMLRNAGLKIGQWMFDGLIDMIKGSMGAAKSQEAVTSLVGQLLTATFNLQVAFSNIGLSIAEGVLAGFLANITGEETAKRMAEAVVTALKNAIQYITPTGQAKLLWDLITGGVRDLGTQIGEGMVERGGPVVDWMQSPAPQWWQDLQGGTQAEGGTQVEFQDGAIRIDASGTNIETVQGAVQSGILQALRAAGVGG
jgi:hypothetical protein